MKLHAHRHLLGKIIFLCRTCWARAGRGRPLPALALPDLGAAVKRLVRLLLEHSGDGLTDGVALVLASSRDNVT